MAEGIRIRHHTRKGQMLPVPLLHKPWSTVGRPECGTCHTVHPCKVLHLTLDDTGAIIVSAEVKADLWRTVNHGGFHVDSVVAKPPTQGITPKTVKADIRGIDLAGGLQLAEPNRRYATVTAEAPESRTVTIDEYVDTANRLGVSTPVALNVLLAKFLGLSIKEPDRGKVSR